MVTNRHLILLLSLGFLFFCSGCWKGKLGCPNTKYSFNLNAEVDKDLDNITTNDTIYLKINAPTNFKDLETGKEVDYSKAENLGMVFHLLKVSDENSTVGAIKDFVFYIAKYKLTRNIKNPPFIENSNSCHKR